MDDFLITPKPRELTKKEINRFNLKYHNGKELKPSYEHTGNIWAAVDDGKLPTYRFYNSCSINGIQVTSGINCLIILKYTPNKDVWEKINIDDVDTFYGVVWFMCLKLQEKDELFDLKQCKHYRVKKGGEWSKYGHYDVYYKCLDCNRIFYQDETSTDEWNALKEKENK
jgi:hypothetical protein